MTLKITSLLQAIEAHLEREAEVLTKARESRLIERGVISVKNIGFPRYKVTIHRRKGN
jgi:hypothetical protein